jgi:hypothetical protein
MAASSWMETETSPPGVAPERMSVELNRVKSTGSGVAERVGKWLASRALRHPRTNGGNLQVTLEVRLRGDAVTVLP